MIYFKLFTDSKLRNKIEVLEEIKRNIRNKRVISCFKTKIEYVSTFFDCGNDRNKGSGVIMKIEGTREEIAWVKEAIKIAAVVVRFWNPAINRLKKKVQMET